MDKIERLRQILNVANEDTVSYKQLSELLKGLAVVITKAKEENRAISDELKALFRDSVTYLKGEHEKLLTKVENLNDKRLTRVEQENRKVLEKALEALDEIKSIVVVDGIDGKDGNRILTVKNQKLLPEDAVVGDLCILEDTKEVFIYE